MAVLMRPVSPPILVATVSLLCRSSLAHADGAELLRNMHVIGGNGGQPVEDGGILIRGRSEPIRSRTRIDPIRIFPPPG
jgi:hypothetical protein